MDIPFETRIDGISHAGLPEHTQQHLVSMDRLQYHAAREGQTCVVAVLGEAGIGKMRLAKEFLLWAKAQRADVLKGGTSEGL